MKGTKKEKDILDVTAVVPLVRQYFPKACHEDLEDAVQEAYLRIVTTYGNGGLRTQHVRGMILQIAKRCYLNCLRKGRMFSKVDILSDDGAVERKNLGRPDMASIDVELFLRTLKAHHRELFLFVLDDVKPTDISEKLGISLDAAYKRIKACKLQFLKWLETVPKEIEGAK